MKDRERERKRQRHRRREKEAPCREPNVGLNPGAPGSGPGPKAALSHPGALVREFQTKIDIPLIQALSTWAMNDIKEHLSLPANM